MFYTFFHREFKKIATPSSCDSIFSPMVIHPTIHIIPSITYLLHSVNVTLHQVHHFRSVPFRLVIPGTNHGITFGGQNTNVWIGHQTSRTHAATQYHGKGNDDNDRIGSGITEPIFFETSFSGTFGGMDGGGETTHGGRVSV